jgi:hypothetical protein
VRRLFEKSILSVGDEHTDPDIAILKAAKPEYE